VHDNFLSVVSLFVFPYAALDGSLTRFLTGKNKKIFCVLFLNEKKFSSYLKDNK
jgi:hypothetical protein